MAGKEQRKTCDICGGSGQLSFFKGVSRFLLSTEECSVCAGTGLQLDAAGVEAADDQTGKTPKKRIPKKKK
jgi:DnaJ-class molecular chaperone